MVHIKRIYDPPEPTDGYRILVDRLWPRGVSKSRAILDLWLKDVAPSPGLRIWFDHDPAKFAEFTRRYQTELDHNPVLIELRQIVTTHQTVTLLYAATNPAVNHAKVLQNSLK